MAYKQRPRIDFVIHIKELEIDNGKKLGFIVLYKGFLKKTIPINCSRQYLIEQKTKIALISSFVVVVADAKKN